MGPSRQWLMPIAGGVGRPRCAQAGATALSGQGNWSFEDGRAVWKLTHRGRLRKMPNLEQQVPCVRGQSDR
jgi:hypothetical protein